MLLLRNSGGSACAGQFGALPGPRKREFVSELANMDAAFWQQWSDRWQ